jgi:hypothetical protein
LEAPMTAMLRGSNSRSRFLVPMGSLPKNVMPRR